MNQTELTEFLNAHGMDRSQFERFLNGVEIDGQKYNPLIADAFEHMKSNDELVAFVQDDAAAYQAYLALRDTGWRTHEMQEHMLGWINCSALVALLRGKGEHQQRFWAREWEPDIAEFDAETVAKFDALMMLSGWTVSHRTLMSEIVEVPSSAAP